MDAKGGTITWYLTANDADFNAAMLRTRAEARSTGRAVDRDFGKGMKNARLSLDDFRRDLGRSAQLFRDFQIALRGFQMTSLILGVTLAGGAIIELVGALTAATQAVIALPGIIAPVIGAFATLKTATFGVGDAFKAVLKEDPKKLAEAMEKLSPAAREFVKSFAGINESFKPIRSAIQEAFFTNLGKQMESVAAVTLPTLKTGMKQVAVSLNGMAQEAARVAKEPFFQDMIAKTLETTATATATLTGAVEPLAQSLAGLVKIGLPYTNMLAKWVVKQAEAAAGYINSSEGQKSLTDAINLGIRALQKLGDLIGSVFNLFVALFQVSNQEGLSLIDTLTDIIDKTTAWVKSAEGQDKLSALFQLANNFLREGAELIGGFVSGVLGLVEWFNKLPTPVKDFATNLVLIAAVAGPVLGYLSSIRTSFNLLGFGAREVGQAFRLLTGVDLGKSFAGIAKEGGLLGNVWTLLSKNPLITVLTILAGIFIYLGTQTTIFQDAFKQLQPVFEKTWQALQPLFEVLGQLAQVLGGAIATIMPVIAQVFGEVLAALLPLIPPILDLVMTLLPIFVQILQFVVQVIQFLIPIITVLAQIIGAVLVIAINIVVALFQFLISIVQAVADAFVAAWNFIVSIWNGAGAFFSGLWDGIVAVFSVVGQFFAGIFSGAWEGIMAGAKAVGDFFAGVWSGIVTVMTPVVDAIKMVGQIIANGVIIYFNLWKAAIEAVINVVTTIIGVLQPLWDILGLIGYAFMGLAQIIWTIISTVFQVLWTIISTIVQIIGVILWGTLMKIGEAFMWVFNNAAAIVTAAFTIIQTVFTTVWGAIVAFFTPIIQFIANLFTTYFNIMFTIVSTVFNAIKGVVTTVFNAIAGFITTVWNGIMAFLQPILNVIANVFSTVFNAIAATVNRVFGLIKQYIINPISEVVGFVGRTIGQIATFIGDAVTDAYNAVAGFVGRFTQAGRNIIDGIVNGIKNGAGAVVDVVKNVCSNALNAVKNFFGIKSPSRVMAQMGNYLMEGFGKGIDQQASTVVDAAKDAAKGVLGTFDNMSASIGGIQSDFTVNGQATGAFGVDLAPGAIENPAVVGNTGPAAVIYQTNEVHTDLDMDQVNRNLTWELGKL